jgi:glycosyltransferase involved in cell wall biosynthesis
MISTMSRISIIIPAFNQARFLGQAIESALGQAGAEVEVIVVDDGSTDDTPSVIARYQTAPGFKSIRQPNAGLPAARNRGLAEATGEYLCFLDSDDYFAPEKCNRQAALLERSQTGSNLHRPSSADIDRRYLPRADCGRLFSPAHGDDPQKSAGRGWPVRSRARWPRGL